MTLCKNAMIVIGSFISYSDQAFETQTFRRYGLNFICMLDETCAVANAARQNLIRVRKFYVHLKNHRAGALVIVFQICYHHAKPFKCLHITCNSTHLLKAFWPIARLVK